MSRSTLDLIDEIGRIDVRPFLAPIPDAESVLVTTVQEGIQFNYRVVKEAGWWVLHSDQVGVKRIEAPNSMFETVRYLDALPRFLTIAVHRLQTDTWLVVPWNESDAAQRGWPDGEPRAMHLVRDAIRPFDVIVARRLGHTLLYDTLHEGLGATQLGEAVRETFDSTNDMRVPGITPDMQKAYSILEDYGAAVSQVEQEQSEAELSTSLEGRLRWHLGFMEADLLGWHESGEGYEVRWMHQGQEYSTKLRRDLQVESAGICLDETDPLHNLSSIVAVLEEGRRRGMDGDGDW